MSLWVPCTPSRAQSVHWEVQTFHQWEMRQWQYLCKGQHTCLEHWKIWGWFCPFMLLRVRITWKCRNSYIGSDQRSVWSNLLYPTVAKRHKDMQGQHITMFPRTPVQSLALHSPRLLEPASLHFLVLVTASITENLAKISPSVEVCLTKAFRILSLLEKIMKYENKKDFFNSSWGLNFYDV